MRLGRLALALAVLAAAPAAAADGVAMFYAGKTVQMLVGFTVGGGYDLYARTLARHLGRHIPGEPAIITQNMPGAGSLKVVNYLYNIAPKDGTALGTFARGIVVEPLLGHTQGIQFEAPKFTWIGSITNEVGVCAFRKGAGIATLDDMRTKSYVIAGSGAGADSEIFPQVLRRMFHLPLTIVTGFPGGSEMNMAMERGEVDGRCGWSWTSLNSRERQLVDEGDITIPLQIALEKHEDLPRVPLIMDLTTTPLERAALRLIVSRQSIARPFAAPPGVPEDRAKALRAAFAATMRDPDFLDEAKKLKLEVRPVEGAAVAALVDEIYAAPPDVVKLATGAVRDSAK